VPFVRVSRDKRGYEHTYLIQPPRVLYWFRTPPGIKVGRTPFDRDTQRAIEAQNPGVVFDWPRIVSTAVAPPIAKDVEHWRERRRAERAVKRARAAEGTELPPAPDATEVEPTEEGELENDVEGDEIVQLAAETPATVEASVTPVTPEQAPGKRRRRRRGGRRRRRTGPRNEGTPGENGTLDQPKAPDDSSHES
jgi:hypothetical protein